MSLIGLVVFGTFKVTVKVLPIDASETEAVTPLSLSAAPAGTTTVNSKQHITATDKSRDTIRLFIIKLLFFYLFAGLFLRTLPSPRLVTAGWGENSNLFLTPLHPFCTAALPTKRKHRH